MHKHRISRGALFDRIVRAEFTARPNRFIVECTLNGSRVRAYLPNPGRLWELFFPGTPLFLVRNDASRGGSTDFTVVAVERDGLPVMLHTHANNLVARRLIEEGRVPGFESASLERPEIKVGRSRFDFLLKSEGDDVIMEVKSCTLFGNRIAMFPDAVTARGTRHLLELEHLARQGTRTAVLFLVHWPRADYFLPEYHTDLEFSRTLLAVRERVKITALSVEWKPNLEAGTVKEIVIPWELVEREAEDRGSYIIIMQLRRDRRLTIGGMGGFLFRKGYYLYTGSAKANLTQRVERHRRLTKKYHWHIDYLRAASDFHAAAAIRASDNLECEIASVLRAIADWQVPGFGAADCGCGGHLFGMAEDPLRRRSFIDVLQYFRIDRLERMLQG